MPFDPEFQSSPRKGSAEESVEFQLGRSDFLLGALQSQNPFTDTLRSPDPERSDSSEWSRGWLAEKSIERRNQEAGAKAYPPWKRRHRA